MIASISINSKSLILKSLTGFVPVRNACVSNVPKKGITINNIVAITAHQANALVTAEKTRTRVFLLRMRNGIGSDQISPF